MKKNGHATPEGEPMEWLRRHVNHVGEACLIWPFCRNPVNGYPRVSKHQGKFSTVASRVMCREAHGEPPTPKHQAAHSCNGGKDGCIHPDHLSWKTAKENSADRFAHGTMHLGEKASRATLTNPQVIEIRGLLGTMTQKELAARFNSSQPAISRIKNGQKWGSIR